MNWLSPCLVACITLASVACSRYEALPPTDAGFSVLDPDSADAPEASRAGRRTAASGRPMTWRTRMWRCYVRGRT